MNTTTHSRTVRLVETAILIAIIILMSVTPIGYLRIGLIEITFLMLPVAIGATAISPSVGALLGLTFGVTSFIQAASGASAFGAALVGISVVRTLAVCLIPRVLAGYLSGLIFRALAKHDKTRLLSYTGGCLSASLLNTVLFVGLLLACFIKTDYITGMIGGQKLFAFIIAFVGMNGLVEIIVISLLGTVISKAVSKIR